MLYPPPRSPGRASDDFDLAGFSWAKNELIIIIVKIIQIKDIH